MFVFRVDTEICLSLSIDWSFLTRLFSRLFLLFISIFLLFLFFFDLFSISSLPPRSSSIPISLLSFSASITSPIDVTCYFISISFLFYIYFLLPPLSQPLPPLSLGSFYSLFLFSLGSFYSLFPLFSSSFFSLSSLSAYSLVSSFFSSLYFLSFLSLSSLAYLS
ncbi:DPH7 [Acanthosepion pharaonis]|uniref:DPH7 n=1 Tax=Acanthosepion pharaonis TaxID=158019 RepID=A0A812EZK8_ACAPH|nr:DPH7 [Sepia pharaonis]